MHAPRFEILARWAKINVVRRIIGKGVIVKDSVVMSTVGFYPGISHVSGDTARLTRHIIFSSSVLVIGYYNLGLALGILLVLIKQPC
jgi:hypothetical protein